MPRDSGCCWTPGTSSLEYAGAVAEWSCSGLQLRVRRFDSDPRLHIQDNLSIQDALPRPNCTPARMAKLVDARDLKSLGGKLPCRFDPGSGHQKNNQLHAYLLNNSVCFSPSCNPPKSSGAEKWTFLLTWHYENSACRSHDFRTARPSRSSSRRSMERRLSNRL